MNIRGKFTALIVTAALLATVLCGCSVGNASAADERFSVTQAGENIISGPESEGAQVYKTISGDKGKLLCYIEIPEIDLPDTQPVEIMVSPRAITGEDVKRFCDSAFPGADAYEYNDKYTKSELEQRIEAFKQELSEEEYAQLYGSNLSEKDKTEISGARAQELAELETGYKYARESYPKVLTEWKFWPQEHYYRMPDNCAAYEDEVPDGEHGFLRVNVDYEGCTYHVWAHNYKGSNFREHSMGMWIETTGMDENQKAELWDGIYSSVKATDSEMECAAAKAKEILCGMNMGDWEIQCINNCDESGRWLIQTIATPVYDGMPVAYQQQLDNINATSGPDYYYEQILMTFSNDGQLCSMVYHGAMEETGKKECERKLLTSGELEAAIEKKITAGKCAQYDTSGGLDEIEKVELHITDSKYGMCRTGNKEYSLVPAVIIYGYYTVYYKNGLSDTVGITGNTGSRALITINCVTGAVIS